MKLKCMGKNELNKQHFKDILVEGLGEKKDYKIEILIQTSPISVVHSTPHLPTPLVLSRLWMVKKRSKENYFSFWQNVL